MKKNYFIAIAVTALMLASTIAQAADFSFSGQFRPRFESQNDANENTTSRDFFSTRVRLNATGNVNANTTVFLQFQSVGDWGNAQADGLDRDSSTGSDNLNDVGFHQAFVTYKGLFGQAVDAKVGRQEVVLDGHRLFGHTGWTTGAQTNDAIRLNHSAGNHEVNYIYIASSEAGSITTSALQNKDLHIVRAATEGVLGGKLTGMFVATLDDSQAATGVSENDFYTIGARQAGKVGGLDYRVEYYHQWGDGGVDASTADLAEAYTTTPTLTAPGDIDRDANMFGIRIGKTFKNAGMSPTFTLWYDNLSGTDDTDVAGNDYGTFNTLQDTGHKFYGLIDNYTSDIGNGTQRYGLQDIAIKAKLNVSAKNVLKVDFHQFLTQTDLEDGDSDTIRTNATTSGAFQSGSNGSGVLSNDLGQEVDVTLVHKYDSNTKMVFGYSHYFTTLTHSYLNGSGAADAAGRVAENDDQDWVYVMVDTKF
jgi:hypothetical protein